MLLETRSIDRDEIVVVFDTGARDSVIAAAPPAHAGGPAAIEHDGFYQATGVKPQMAATDYLSGMLGAIGVLAARLAQLERGGGYEVRTSLLAPALLLLVGFLAYPFFIGLWLSVTNAAVAGVESRDAGLASALLNTSQQLGGALGLAILSTIATSYTNSVLASDPHGGLSHALVEGCAIAAHAIGAETTYIYIRGEFTDPLAWLHAKIEGIYEYTLLLFIPSSAPYDLMVETARRVEKRQRRGGDW